MVLRIWILGVDKAGWFWKDGGVQIHSEVFMFVNFVMKDKTFRPMIVTVVNDGSENGVVILDGMNDRQNLPANVDVNLDMQTVAHVKNVLKGDGTVPGTWVELV